MKTLYVRCMDGHYFRITRVPVCPLDGSMALGTSQAARLAALTDDVSLESVAAGLTEDELSKLAV